MKATADDIAIETLHCINCITGEPEVLKCSDDALVSITRSDERDSGLLYGPGLIDLQVNGIRGIDFNRPTLTVNDVTEAAKQQLTQGVTQFLPTVITNADDHVITILNTISEACENDQLTNDCIAGIHLEGPFISPAPGARGAHEQAFIKAPDWDLFRRFQDAAGGRIKIITLAPEWEGSATFIEKCVASGVIVSIGHSVANTLQIRSAVEAGACMSTHLGNGVPLSLPRHPNIIWDQLAEEPLHACIIADGLHIPDSFIKVVMKAKGEAVMLASDSTCFTGMPPGEYTGHIGGDVVVDENKKISLKSEPGLLAGAAKSLLENVQTLTEHHLCSLSAAWKMASLNVIDFLRRQSKGFEEPKNDLVIFFAEGKTLRVHKVIKSGRTVYRNEQCES